MALNNIEELLEKYNNAETSIKEEEQLKAYFKSNDVSPHLEPYKQLFQYFSQSQQEQFTKDVSLKSKQTKIYQWISVAVVVVLMLGIFIPNWQSKPKTLSNLSLEEQKVYNKTIATFKLISLVMNKGKQQLNSLTMISDNFNQGIELASKLSEFSKATHKIFKKK